MDDYRNYADGSVLVTEALQKAIDAVGEGGHFVLQPGRYLTGSLFLHPHMTFELAEGAVLLGSQDLADYPMQPADDSSTAYDEKPCAVLNAFDCDGITICGSGTVDGQGEIWWEKFWGKPEENRKGGMLGSYPEGLRWAVDGDCLRPKNVLVKNSNGVTLRDFHSERSGTWNIHLKYCSDILVENITIARCTGPSTDGIDLDSCRNGVVRGCHISCRDDAICLKAGRDAEGLKANRPCENIEVCDCHLVSPSEGITLGSETSGGIRHVSIHDCTFDNAAFGFRIKSARTRGGTLEDIRVSNLHMRNVREPFSFQLNWFPAFSYCKIPDDYTGPVSERWKRMCAYVPPELGLPTLRDLVVENVTAVVDDAYASNRTPLIFSIDAAPERPIENVTFRHMTLSSRTLGNISGIKGLHLDDVTISV